MAKGTRERLLEAALEIFARDGYAGTNIFSAMMENGTIKKCDPHILAFSYTAPITVLIHLCDRNTDKEAEAMDKMEKFIRNFVRCRAQI